MAGRPTNKCTVQGTVTKVTYYCGGMAHCKFNTTPKECCPWARKKRDSDLAFCKSKEAIRELFEVLLG
jgi:hypothetical protein